MTNIVKKVSGLVILLLASGIPALAAPPTAGLTVPVTSVDNTFSGAATINGFVHQGSQIVAIGTVANSTHTAFAGVAWQVTLSADPSGGSVAYSGPIPALGHLTRIAWSPDRENGARLVPVQAPPAPSTCAVLNISLGQTSVNIGGATVTLMPISLDISGMTGTPVGGLVCQVDNLVTTVGNAVGAVTGLLNSLLSTLTGALSGVTGALP